MQTIHTLQRALLTVFSALLIATVPGRPASAEEGTWSKSAISLPVQRAIRFPSPDRKKAVMIDGLTIGVTDEGDWLPGIEGYSILLPAEFAWSPDSKAFFMTASEAGADGPWYVSVFLLEYNRVNYYDVTSEAAGRFRERYPCLAADEPDMAAIKWLKDANKLLVAAAVPARSSCAEKSAVRGYVIEIPSGKILKELEPKKLLEDWGEFLGPRLRPVSHR